jgi:transcriptional regulator with XRE-family HTH domain
MISRMARTPEDVAADLGRRLREARLKHGRTLDDVAASTGVSRSTQGRMELGRGGGVALDTWATLVAELDVDLFGPIDDRLTAYRAAVVRLAERGGWRATELHGRGVWLDRPARDVHRGLGRYQAPAERAVIQFVTVLTDFDVEWRWLRQAVGAAWDVTPPGTVVAGLLVIVRSSANLRRSTHGWWRRSTWPWLRALQEPTGLMPDRPGVAWLTPRGTHFLPVV